MHCDDIREALSAAADGEAHPVEQRVLDAHLARCAACAAFRTEVTDLDRRVRVRAAAPVPDLSRTIVTMAAPARAREWPRYLLLWVALAQLAVAVPALLDRDAGASIHAAHELGSWDVALAVGLLVAAWQPRRAAGLLPFALALAGAMVATAVLDVAGGHAPAIGEAQHVLDLIGVAALWLLTRSEVPSAADVRRRLRAV
jgi:predicted anti-sigma-YlaC factor YlaD